MFPRQVPMAVIVMCGDPDPGRFLSDLGRAIGNFFHDHFSSVVYEYPATTLKNCDYVYLGNVGNGEKADIEITENQETDPKSPSDYGAVEIFVEPAPTPVQRLDQRLDHNGRERIDLVLWARTHLCASEDQEYLHGQNDG